MIVQPRNRVEFSLGQPVVARAIAVRTPTDDNGGKGWHWERFSLDEPVHGIVVGLRTKQAGEIVHEIESDDLGYEMFRWNAWRRTGSYAVVLVATDLRRRHLVCPVDDVEAEYAET